jgi:hypothetical protein
MKQLSWVTPQNNIGNILTGVPVSLPVLATSTNVNATITYQLISGSLPDGLSLSNSGVISGTPTISLSNNYFTSMQYSFIARASSNDGATPIDGAFSLILSNTINSDFNWVTPPGDLGTVLTGEFYQLALLVSETLSNVSVTFSFISGELPPGMQVTPNGFLQGVPTLLNATAVNQSEIFKFSIRAQNSMGHVRDQGFSITITNVYGPTIEPTVTNLGEYFDGTYFSQQLTVMELNPNVSITWSNITSLPPGLTLSSTGLIAGFLEPAQLVGSFGPTGYDGSAVVGQTVTLPGNLMIGSTYTITSIGTTDFTLVGATSNTLGLTFTANGAGTGTGTVTYTSENNNLESEYDTAPYDFNQLSQSVYYAFTIQAYDGANYDLQTYRIEVISRSGYTADNAVVLINDTYLTVDSGNNYIPVIRNGNIITLPLGRSGSYYAYKFDGYDFQGDPLEYSLANVVGTFDCYVPGVDAGFDWGSSDDNHTDGVPFDSYNPNQSATSNLPGVFLDATSGWLYGRVSPQTSAYETYTFGLQVSKTRDGVKYTSTPIYFTLPVLGEINNVVEWITPTDLGTINGGAVSQFKVEAKSFNGKPMVYSLPEKTGVSVRLPQGLELLSSGEITGRVTFESFSIDQNSTTFDKTKLTCDRIYNFSVKVSTTDGTAFATKQFKIKLNVINQTPYDNLYLHAMPAFDQRQIFNSVITDTEIFPPELIYRANDPWFGLAKDIKMLFLPGLNSKDLNTYVDAIVKNHYTKNYSFGDVGTAVVLDKNYQVKYEVVYINILDPEIDSAGNGPKLEIDLTTKIANPYIDANGDTFKILYPNSSINMIERLVENIGYSDQSSLPEWMTSNQLSPTGTGVAVPLGYTRAAVLAHTVPGASKLIAYRLQNSGINFNNIEFSVDRYFLDDFYSTNFDGTKFKTGKETTFDALPVKNIGAIVAKVDYAVSVPFNQINGRPVEYIISSGNMDGANMFEDGQTLIFIQQQNYINGGPYDGWVNYTDAYLGDNILTAKIEGYDSEGYDVYSVIPGYLEKAQGISPINKRGGVWKINILNNIVNLTFVKEIATGQKVQILSGTTYSTSTMYYNNTLSQGQTVPYYSVFKYQASAVIAHRTTFNGDSTKFFSYRDTYYAPESQDKYVKFPLTSPFN